LVAVVVEDITEVVAVVGQDVTDVVAVVVEGTADVVSCGGVGSYRFGSGVGERH
jgi:hypothetical protein